MHWTKTLLSLPPFSLVVSAFFILLGGLFLMALFGFLLPFLVGTLLLLFMITVGLALRGLILAHDWERMFILAGILLLALISSLTVVPSVMTGRDQGSIAEAAWRLSQNHSLAFEANGSRVFFDLYGPGTALNFPGFAYTDGGELLTQFPLLYTSYLGGFLSIFGIAGYTIANLTLLALFGWSLFELLSLFVPLSLRVFGVVLGLVSFLPLWMTQFTLTENLAAPLFILLTIGIIRFMREKSLLNFWLAVLPALFFPFVRIEGFAFLALTGCILLVSRASRSFIFSLRFLTLGVPALAFAFIFLRDFFMNLPLYTIMGKVILKHWNEFEALGTLVKDETSLSLGAILFVYGLLPIFIAGAAGAILLVVRKEYVPLIMLFLAGPTLLYLILPSITPDHPWMLRRYSFSLYPTAVFFTVLGIHHFMEIRKYTHVRPMVLAGLGLFFLFFQFSPSLIVLRTSEGKGLLEETERFAERFDSRDLILIDRLASGDPFSMIAGPLNSIFSKSAVYFFNPNDLDRLELAGFDRVYLISPLESLNLYATTLGDRLVPVETLSLSVMRLRPPQDAFSRLSTETIVTDNVLFEFKR